MFSAAGSGAIPPRPTLADSGDDFRRAHPGAAANHGLDAASWERVGRNLADAARRVRSRGFEPTFHHHAGTFVETPDEIDLLLDRVDVGLTLDTGHLLIGGGDPAEAWDRWGSRINHVHLKDVNRDRLRAIVGAGGGMVEVWSGGTFVPLGDGDLDTTAFLDDLVKAGYAGWVVIEQDVLAVDHYDFDAIVQEHRRNRDVLRPWF
ncbi:sugar phosphate isomerase/epimerase [Leifsonia sp. EB41]|uniref:TIM barrel protein n=1 Tax=Leifsonia sp. EB41 TaxID=3156260 RepID=UPI0035162023